VVDVIRRRYPDFWPSSYLNGTEQPDSFKWLCAMRVGTKDRIYGYMTGKWMEFAQTAHHLFTNRYLSYTPPSSLARGRTYMAFGSMFDKGMRRTAAAYGRTLLQNPLNLMRKAYMQSVLIIQPIDFNADGGQNMCDGCPDMTVHDGKLVWSCRLEEPRKYGTFVRTVPKGMSIPPSR
jgi:hypothetical protein